MRAFLTMIKTESKLTLRCMDSIFFGIAFPIGVALVLGFIYGDKLAFKDADYTFIQQSFGAIASIGVCVTGLMGVPLSIANYRHMKILKRYKVTPISPGVLLFTQVIIQLVIATTSLISVFVIDKLFFGYEMQGSVGIFILSYLLVIVALYGIGMMIASIAPNLKVANLLCTLIYFPMVFLSGATIPYEIMPRAMQRIADVFPLTQGIKLLKGSSLGLEMDNMMFSICIMIAFAVIGIAVSIKTFKWE